MSFWACKSAFYVVLVWFELFPTRGALQIL